MKGTIASRSVLVLAGTWCMAIAQSPGTFTLTGSMTAPRAGHTATLLTNGKVLIAGGYSSFMAPVLASAELFDPSTGVFTATGNMATPRSYHTATLLPDGKVLVAGGSVSGNGGPNSLLTSAELYEPSSGTFIATGSLIAASWWHQATLLANGKVVLIGGSGRNGTGGPGYGQIYDPVTGKFSRTGDYASDTSNFNTVAGGVSTLLPDGRVLIVWEEYSADLYDPATNSFTRTGNPIDRSYDEGLPTATLLLNGKVLVAGGADDIEICDGTELYDPSTGIFSAAANMNMGHALDTATLLPDGTVLVAGSTLYAGGSSPGAEFYAPATGSFTTTGSLNTPRGLGHTATLLNNGQILVTGGTSPFPIGIASAEIYQSAVLIPAPALFSLSGDGQGPGAIWHASTGLVVSSANPAVAEEALSMYVTSLNDGSVIPPQVAVAGLLAKVLYFGSAPGYPGYNQVNFILPDGLTPGATVPLRLSYLDRSSNQVTIAVQ
jgi:hypothetical protein